MIKPLKECENDFTAGNKARNLAKIANISQHCAKGFVVGYDMQDSNKITKAINVFCSNNELYAVRSSSTVEDSSTSSYAGMFESYLGVKKENILEAIQKVRASAKNKRVQILNQKNKDIKVGVIVQKMIPSEVSGVCFTANPSTKKADRIVIEAAEGLGEFVVQNEVTPDSYTLTKSSLEIIKKNIQTQHKVLIQTSEGVVEKPKLNYEQKLSDNHIKTLAHEAKILENKLGYACDIEWGLHKNRIYILQVRPITFIKKEKK